MTLPTSLTDAAAALRAGTCSSRDLVEAALAAAEAGQPRTNAFIRLDPEAVRAAADAADRERHEGRDRGPLHGLPVSLKDLVDVAGEITTAASHVLADRVATHDATLVTRLREAGVVLFGKTNLHEFALGTTSEDSAFGAVHHPADAGHSAGGSSGGSAAAIATGAGLASIGTDTGGSIRIPAAACGVVGLKPSFGDIPTDGIVPLSTSFDHAGPLTRTVQDAALLWMSLSYRLSAPRQVPVPGDLTLGVVGGVFNAMTPDVRAAFDAACDCARRAGIRLRPVTIAGTEAIMPTYVNIVLAEGAAWHAPYLDARASAYTPRVRDRFLAGREISAVAYLAAQAHRRELRAHVDAALAGCDALLLPTLPMTAPRLGQEHVAIDGLDAPLPVRSAMLRNTQLFNMTGHPALSLPVPSGGLPVAWQLVGRRGDTADLLAMAAACETIVGCP